MTTARRLVGELLGTALLLAAVVGSGIMGEKLSGGNVAIALLANTLATNATLVTLIFTFGAVSGAHSNPAVTLADASQGGMRGREVPGYIVSQAAGAMLGVWAAHIMFAEPVLQARQHVRSGGSHLYSKFIATCGLPSVIWGCGRLRAEAVPFAVGLYITGAYCVHVIRESRRDVGEVFHGYFCRHSARRCFGLHGCPACWRVRREVPFPMAGAVLAQTSTRCCCASH
jgi:glycerol uptake facilitator-like aquaporin